MADNDPILQSHHVIEQSFFRKHELLLKLASHGLIDEHASANRLYLPMDGKLAEELETSPHRGRTRSSYTDGILQELDRIMDSADGVAAMDDDAVALKRVSAKVAELQETLKVALVNGDVYATTPDRLTNDEANAQNRKTFSDLDRYRAEHPQQLKTLRSMGAVESEWAAITHSEQRIAPWSRRSNARRRTWWPHRVSRTRPCERPPGVQSSAWPSSKPSNPDAFACTSPTSRWSHRSWVTNCQSWAAQVAY